MKRLLSLTLACSLLSTALAQTPPLLAWQQGAHTSRVETVGHSPNGLWRFTTGADDRLNVYRTSDNRLMYRFWHTLGGPATISNDSAQLAFYGSYGNYESGVQFLNLTSGLILPFKVPMTSVSDIATYRATDGTRYLYTVNNTSASKWVFNGLQYVLEWTWSNLSYGSHRLQISPDGTKLAVTANPSKVFDVSTHAELASLNNGLSASFSPSGLYLAIGGTSSAKNVKIYQTLSWALVQTLNTNSYVYGVDWYADGQYLACSKGANLRRYRFSDAALMWEALGSGYDIRDASIAPNGQCLIAGGYNLGALWNSSGTTLTPVSSGSARITSICYSPIGSFLAAATDDPAIRLWNPWTGALHRSMYHVVNNSVIPNKAVAFTGDGTKLISTDSTSNTVTGNIRVFNPVNGAQINSQVMFQGSTPYIIDVSKKPVGANGYLLATADGLDVRVWSLTTYLGLRILTGSEDYVSSLKFSPDGKFLAVGSRNGKVLVYSTSTWVPTDPLLSASNYYGISVDFGPDETSLFVLSGSTIFKFVKSSGNVWNSVLQREFEYSAVSIRTPSVSASRDGRSVLACYGTNACLFNASNLSFIRQWKPFEGESDVMDCEISPDSTALAFCDWSGVTRAFQNINGPALISATIAPTQVIGGSTAVGRVSINMAAPTGGVRIYLSDNSSALSTPSTVTIPSGQTYATFAVSTKTVAETVTRSVTATCAGVTKTADLVIARP